jgi:hypothetical protein
MMCRRGEVIKNTAKTEYSPWGILQDSGIKTADPMVNVTATMKPRILGWAEESNGCAFVSFSNDAFNRRRRQSQIRTQRAPRSGRPPISGDLRDNHDMAASPYSPANGWDSNAGLRAVIQIESLPNSHMREPRVCTGRHFDWDMRRKSPRSSRSEKKRNISSSG